MVAAGAATTTPSRQMKADLLQIGCAPPERITTILFRAGHREKEADDDAAVSDQVWLEDFYCTGLVFFLFLYFDDEEDGMAYRRANYRGSRRYGMSFAAKRTGRRRGFAASPAGQHRRLAMNAFRIARAAGARGNQAHRRRMIAAGKRALALSKAEFRLWKRGLALRARALATHRAAKRRAQAARRAPAARARFRYA